MTAKTQYFDTPKIIYDPSSTEALVYRYYDADRQVMGKSMREWLRISICYWHTFCWQGNDIFGAPTFSRPWLKSSDPMQRAFDTADACFEFVEKLGLDYFAFHDRDAAPAGETLQQSNDNLERVADVFAEKMQETGVKLLWGTANLFAHPRYMAGAATNPNPEVFAYALGQVKKAMDVTHRLNGANYVLWGGREGYDTLHNTDLTKEVDQLARFLHLLVDYKHKIGFKGLLLIEPKPCEPTKHQYDYDSATVYAFLQKYGLEKEFAVNIEGNHATLAGHSFAHEVAYACSNDIFGSVDINRGDPQLGWDTDQFPYELSTMAEVMYYIVQHGGFTSGGFNFDTKLRRQSIDLEDLFYGHVGGVDMLAKSLLKAEKMIKQKCFSEPLEARYLGWQGALGQSIMNKDHDLESIVSEFMTSNIDPAPVSGKQELLDNRYNQILLADDK